MRSTIRNRNWVDEEVAKKKEKQKNFHKKTGTTDGPKFIHGIATLSSTIKWWNKTELWK